MESNFIELLGYKIVYRKYASLVVIAGIDQQENELGVYEFIQVLMDNLDQYFQNMVKISFVSFLILV